MFLGVVYGTIGLEVDELLESTPELADYLASAGHGGTLTESYFATVALLLGLLTTGYVVQGLRLRTEEADGRAELVLGKPLSRSRWAGGTCSSWSPAARSSSGSPVAPPAWSMAYVPATCRGSLDSSAQRSCSCRRSVVAGIALLLYGLSARLAVLSWVALAGAVVVALLADALGLPWWVRNVSPFAHLPQVPAADLTAGAPTLLILLAAGLVAGGLVALRQRDVMTS